MKQSLILSALALPWIIQADQLPTKKEHPHYNLIDLGSLGGPEYYQSFSGQKGRLINNQGTVVGGMDTAIADPFCFNEDCLVSHAFQWKNGSLSDLGTLAFNPAGNFSQAFWINERGLSVGVATDRALGALGPALRAVLWKEGQIIDLGTLGGTDGFAQAINNHDQVVGWALNTTPDLIGIWPFQFGTQQRAVLWQNGMAEDLGTLGGPSAWATHLNDRGQVIGQSYKTDPTLIPVELGDAVWFAPTGAFLWEDGAMVDLGSLGGTFALPNQINNRGQIVGFMTLAGDESQHPFLWNQGQLTDLGTLGGSNGEATLINEAGDVAGVADSQSGGPHGFVWRKGVMTGLGAVASAGDFFSTPYGINSRGQIVGSSGNGSTGRAFLWEDDGPMVDLNALIPPGSSLHLRRALSINDRGEITGFGLLPNGDQHPFLLIPVGQ